MKRIGVCLLIFLAPWMFAQDGKKAPDDLIGAIVWVSGDVEGEGVVLAYEADEFIDLLTCDGSELRSLFLKGLRYHIDIVNGDKEMYRKLKLDGVIGPDGRFIEREDSLEVSAEPPQDEVKASEKEPPDNPGENNQEATNTQGTRSIRKQGMELYRSMTPSQRAKTLQWAEDFARGMKINAKAQKALDNARIKNTRTEYEKVVGKYPETGAAREARAWLEDPVHAFVATCKLGDKEAFEGYRESFPGTVFRTIIDWYVMFFESISLKDDLTAIRRFAGQYPDNPFGRAALAMVPSAFTKRNGSKIAVRINLNNLVWKGLLGGSNKPENVRNAIWKHVTNDLAKEGIEAKLLDDKKIITELNESEKILLAIDYTEEAFEYRSNIPRGNFLLNTASLLDELGKSLLLPNRRIFQKMTLVDARESRAISTVFRNFANVSHICPFDSLEFIKKLGLNSEDRLACIMLSLAFSNFDVFEELEVKQLIDDFISGEN